MPLRPALALAVVALVAAPVVLADSTGDVWDVRFDQLYARPDGSQVWLTAHWQLYARWPASTTANITDLRVMALPIAGGAEELPNATLVTFQLPASWPTFNVTLQADGLVWKTTWTWEVYDSCSVTTSTWKQRLMLQQLHNTIDRDVAPLVPEQAATLDAAQDTVLAANDEATGAGDQVRGDLEDLGHATTLHGEALVPAMFFSSPSGDWAVSGTGGARKVSPGPDTYWNCDGSGLPI